MVFLSVYIFRRKKKKPWLDNFTEKSLHYLSKTYSHAESLKKQPYTGRIVHLLVNEAQIDILRIYHSARKLDENKLK